MTMTIDEIDEIEAEIAMWERRRDKWLLWGGEVAHRGAMACLDEIEKLRGQRAQFDETIRKKEPAK